MPTVDVQAPPFIPVKPHISIGTAGSDVTIPCAAESVDVDVDQDENVVETFCGTYRTFKAEQWTITVTAYMSYGTTPQGLWNNLRPLANTIVPFEFRPDTAVASVSNPKMTGTAFLRAFPFFKGSKGAPESVEIVLAVQGTPTFATA